MLVAMNMADTNNMNIPTFSSSMYLSSEQW